MAKEDEMILVIARDIIVPQSWSGINPKGLDSFEQIVRENGEFRRRGDMENDPSYKQIIPYMVFRFMDRYFLMQRSGQGGEARLYNRYSLGIGGHINKQDLAGATIMEWARREFDEEVDYRGQFTFKALGLLNDDTDEVGQVHLGYVTLIEGTKNQIQIRDEHQSGKLTTLSEIRDVYDSMETWSRFLYDFLVDI